MKIETSYQPVMNNKFTVLGAGLAGISAAYHLGHHLCVIFEKKNHPFGHIYSEEVNGFTWDEGPHVSFTKNEYVKNLFKESTSGDFIEKDVQPVNYFHGYWIEHPVQSNLYAVPEPLRTDCLNDLLSSRETLPDNYHPCNYRQWLEAAFGQSLTNHFYEKYTKKYWTMESRDLHTKWIGSRVYFPDVGVAKEGYKKKLSVSTHYITTMRYPKNGGYKSFASNLIKNSEIHLQHEVDRVDLSNKCIFFKNGIEHHYNTLIATLPLPEFVKLCNPPEEVLSAANELNCSELFLVNIEVNHPAVREESWLYVYDEEKLSTRINFTESLSPNNAPTGMSGIQVEVYFSRYKPRTISSEQLVETVLTELLQMGLIVSRDMIKNYFLKHVSHANIIFDLNYETNLDTVLDWLSNYGLVREGDDLEPMTNWEEKLGSNEKLGSIILSGRFGQWKYFWTDDCVLRGKFISLHVL
jgi:protoporphyrinogen oxidase